MCYEAMFDGAELLACYQTICGTSSLEIQLFGETVACPNAGGPVTSQGVTVTCPAFAEVCQKEAYLSSWPTFSSIVPSSGPRHQGVDVEINGEFFDTSASYSITIGGVPVTSYKVKNSNLIQAKSGNSCRSEAGPLADVVIEERSSGKVGTGFAAFEFTGPQNEDCEENAPKKKKITALQIALIVFVVIFGIAAILGCSLLGYRFLKRSSSGYSEL